MRRSNTDLVSCMISDRLGYKGLDFGWIRERVGGLLATQVRIRQAGVRVLWPASYVAVVRMVVQVRASQGSHTKHPGTRQKSNIVSPHLYVSLEVFHAELSFFTFLAGDDSCLACAVIHPLKSFGADLVLFRENHGHCNVPRKASSAHPLADLCRFTTRSADI